MLEPAQKLCRCLQVTLVKPARECFLFYEHVPLPQARCLHEVSRSSGCGRDMGLRAEETRSDNEFKMSNTYI